MAIRGRGRIELNSSARVGRFKDKTPEVFHPQSGEVSVTVDKEALIFVAPLDTLIKGMTFSISQVNPPKESPQTKIYVKFVTSDGLEIKFITRDIFDGLNSYLIPRALARLDQGTTVYIQVSKTISVIYSFDMRGEYGRNPL